MSTALLVMWMWAAQGHMTAQNWNVLGDCKTNAETGTIDCRQYAPVDVPAVRHSRGKICLSGHNTGCEGKLCKWECDVVEPEKWTCTDKSRVLLTSEDGAKHCIKFGVR